MSAAFFGFSTSIMNHTNSPDRGASDGSVSTNDFIERQVWHHVAHASMKIGTLRSRAILSAVS